MTTVDVVTVENKKLFAAEVAVILLLFYADVRQWLPIGKTPYLLALAWMSLRLRGFRWRDAGLVRPDSWTKTIALGVAGGTIIAGLGLFVSHPLLESLLGVAPGLPEADAVRGNVAAFAMTLAVVLLLALTEEMAFRGYMMTRFARMLAGDRAAWIVSLAVASLLFGLSHADRGVAGMLEGSVKGVLLGGLYLATDRNLVAPIVAHGVANTVDLTLVFLGAYPGM